MCGRRCQTTPANHDTLVAMATHTAPILYTYGYKLLNLSFTSCLPITLVHVSSCSLQRLGQWCAMGSMRFIFFLVFYWLYSYSFVDHRLLPKVALSSHTFQTPWQWQQLTIDTVVSFWFLCLYTITYTWAITVVSGFVAALSDIYWPLALSKTKHTWRRERLLHRKANRDNSNVTAAAT